MADITLTIRSGSDQRSVALTSDRLVIGRADDVPAQTQGQILIADAGLAARHASINRAGARLWILDEGSTSGTFVNHQRVPPQGLQLADGDQIFLGDHTTLTVALGTQTIRPHDIRAPRNAPAPSPVDRAPTTKMPLPLLVVILVVPVLCLAVLIAAGRQFFGARGANERNAEPPIYTESPAQIEPPVPTSSATSDAQPDQPTTTEGADLTSTRPAPVGAKLYLQMSPDEQLAFVEQQARHVSMLMGNRPYVFNEEVLGYIKQYVDVYARRVGNNSNRLWGEDLRFTFARARTKYAPPIIRAFSARGVPPVVGLYLVMIETEYHNISSENTAGAAGLFQFIGPTARLYGVEPSERDNVDKMAPAAARYMADRIAEFGSDSMSVALAIAGYNRSPDSVRRDLRDVLNSQNKERSFWTLVANSDKLDHWFQNENVKYVPKFFAAAIVGENPDTFNLDMRKLSTYTTPAPQSDAATADTHHTADH